MEYMAGIIIYSGKTYWESPFFLIDFSEVSVMCGNLSGTFFDFYIVFSWKSAKIKPEV